jgi:hypothetical protein
MKIPQFSPYFINQTEKSYLHFEKKINENSTIKIDCICVKNSNKKWRLEIDFILATPNDSSKKFYEEKRVIELDPGERKFIGCWNKAFEKDGVSVNFSPEIPLGLLDDFSDQTLVDILSYENGIRVQSNYLSGFQSESVEK